MVKNITLFCLLFSGFVYASDSVKLTGAEFINSLSKKAAIVRLDYFESFVNRSVNGVGQVHSIEMTSGPRNYDSKNIITIQYESADSDLLLIYRLFSSNDLSLSELKGKKVFFAGKLLLVTPLDSARKKFVCDILLNELSVYAN